MKFFKKNYLIISFLLFYFIIISYKLIFHSAPFYDWDESLYVQSGKEMIENKYFLFPVWQGIPWLDKPPLIPFLYGSIIKLVPFITPEISTRMFTLFISTLLLYFVYLLYNKVLKDNLLSTLAVIITAFTPIFLQRAQVINLDLYLLLGWLGYVLFFEKKYLSLFFLFISVFSKSLIGFYPAVIIFGYYLYLLIFKYINLREFKKQIFRIATHIGILSLWFLSMIFIFGNQFIKQHIIESHFKRVTSSIEFHFGQRTFYLNLVKEQYGLFLIFILIGIISLFFWLKRNKFEPVKMLYSLYLLPWFLFLNLTKTKIFWYFYSAVPQFAFLAVITGSLLKKNKNLYLAFSLILSVLVFYKAFYTDSFFNTFYSNKEPHYYLSLYAKDKCNELDVLLNKQSRKSFDELEKMNLLITTTKWWGSHPSMVYYFGKRINFLYSEKEYNDRIKELKTNDCIVVEKEESNIIKSERKFSPLKTFDYLTLYRKI